MAPAEAPGPWVGPTILLAVAIVVGANQLALLVCGHRAQLTRPLVRAGSLVAAPPWARGQACTEEGDTLQTIQEGETGPGGPGSGDTLQTIQEGETGPGGPGSGDTLQTIQEGETGPRGSGSGDTPQTTQEGETRAWGSRV